MKCVLALFALAFCLMLGQGQVLAEDTPPVAPVPDFTGTWTGPFKVIRAHGISSGTITLHVTEQDGPLLKGVKSWETGGEGNVAGVDVQRATAPLVGVVDFDGKSLYFAMVGDDGIHTARLTAHHTLQVVYIEAGFATAFRAELTRKK
ncbi:MAG: hypothetical protein ACOYB4_08020 [Methyloceanibacter sp.]